MLFVLRIAPEFVERRLIGDDGNFGLEFGDLAGEKLDVAPGDQGIDAKAIRPYANHVQSAGADGSGGSQKRKETSLTLR